MSSGKISEDIVLFILSRSHGLHSYYCSIIWTPSALGLIKTFCYSTLQNVFYFFKEIYFYSLSFTPVCQ